MFSKIEVALRKLIAESFPDLDIAYENVQFKPGNEDIYLKLNFLPADVDSVTLSMDDRVFVGMLQVTVVSPPLTGSDSAKLIADEVANILFNGRMLDVKEANCQAYLNSHGQVFPAVPGDSSYSIPVRCYYRADKFGA